MPSKSKEELAEMHQLIYFDIPCQEIARRGFLAGYAAGLGSDEIQETVTALRQLRNEVRGTLSAHELAIRYDSGNSNWRCLELSLERADKILQAFQSKIGGGM